jgi:hypothetical protein
MAAARPIPGAHSIWELVRHMTVWANVARRRIAAGETIEPTPDEDFPPLTGVEDTVDWDCDKHELFLAHEALAKAVEAQGDPVPDEIYTTAHGVAQHTLYHTGQIVLLKRALTP